MNWHLAASIAAMIAIFPAAWFLVLWQERLEARIGTNMAMSIVVAGAVLMGLALGWVVSL